MARIAEDNRTAKALAIIGALLTGATGVGMAGYSVMAGEETGAGALLAASALAFGLLARTFGSRETPVTQAGAPVNGATQGDLSSLPVLQAPDPATLDPSLADCEPVTDRELEVLSLVAEGFSNKRISGALGISERTVKNHLTVTMGKLQASDRTHAVVTAYRMGCLAL
jgi:ATP/maltotriose-dependent transcriptional regulator MalT